MSSMLQLFSLLASLLLLSFLFLFILEPKSLDRDYSDEVLTLSKLPGFALSSGFIEYRVRSYDDRAGSLYPKMSNYKNMDFIYAH